MAGTWVPILSMPEDTLGAAGCTRAVLAWVVAAGRQLERTIQGRCTSTAQYCIVLGGLGYCGFFKNISWRLAWS